MLTREEYWQIITAMSNITQPVAINGVISVPFISAMNVIDAYVEGNPITGVKKGEVMTWLILFLINPVGTGLQMDVGKLLYRVMK